MSGARGLTHGLHGTDSLGRAAHGSALWVWLSQKLEALGAQVDEQLSVLRFQAAHALNSDRPSRWDAEEPRIQVPGHQTGDLTVSWSHHNYVKIKSPLLNVSVSENCHILPKLCFIENFIATSSFFNYYMY